MAEVHFLGEISSGFNFPENKLCVRYKIKAGSGWKLVTGTVEGQTQTDWPIDQEECFFNHLIDLHYGSRGIQGWPQILIEVYLVDANGRRLLYGYGTSYLPCSAGYEEILINTWRPADKSVKGKLRNWLLGTGPELIEPEAIISTSTQQRQKFAAESMGTVKLKLYTITKHFEKYGVET